MAGFELLERRGIQAARPRRWRGIVGRGKTFRDPLGPAGERFVSNRGYQPVVQHPDSTGDRQRPSGVPGSRLRC